MELFDTCEKKHKVTFSIFIDGKKIDETIESFCKNPAVPDYKPVEKRKRELQQENIGKRIIYKISDIKEIEVF